MNAQGFTAASKIKSDEEVIWALERGYTVSFFWMFLEMEIILICLN